MTATAILPARRATTADEQQILALMRRSLGWLEDEHYQAFFRWKHQANPFGASPGWVATDGDIIAGFRTFMRWRFEKDGEIVTAVRAVDTATHPDYRGQGIFTQLTKAALEDLRADGVGFVFNTPNDQSLPGYLKMGWEIVGRLGVGFRPRSVASLVTVARARTPAELGSLPTTAGLPAPIVLEDAPPVSALLAKLPRATGLRTHRTAAFLRWRYGLPALHYRALLLRGEVEDGVLFFRLRRRGPAVELVIADLLVPPGRSRTVGPAIRRLVQVAGADYAVGLSATLPNRTLVPLPRAGPVLTQRPLCFVNLPPLAGWHMTMGDVELF